MKFRNMCLVSALCVGFALTMIPHVFAVEVGEKAPDFELPSTQGGKLKLSGLQGIIVQSGRLRQIPGGGHGSYWDQRQCGFFAESFCRFSQAHFSSRQRLSR